MDENSNAVTLNGTPMTLIGKLIQVGAQAPDFKLLDNDMQQVGLDAITGKTLIISVVPSLDTPVCDMQTRTFNKAAVELGADVEILTISMDLPFAQKRWCGAAGVEAVRTLSDHRYASFGEAYGLLIGELRLLARAVIVVDEQRVVRYVQLVPEISAEPDYNEVIARVAELI
ncbi:MAG: thiol peroxidase [Candidatus Alcyoniella australis]|nr:thiol peroxidase [Candidatus Alcyoniella australis]